MEKGDSSRASSRKFYTIIAAFGVSAFQSIGNCPCNCHHYEGTGDYVFDRKALTGTVGPVNLGHGHYHTAYAYLSGDDTVYVGAEVTAYASLFTDSASANAVASGLTKRMYYKWGGPPGAAPGCRFTVGFSGNGYVGGTAAVSSWDATATGSADSNVTGSAPGSPCDGSLNLNTISGGLTGVSISVNTSTGFSANGGAQSGDSKGFTFGGSVAPSSGAHDGDIVRTWSVSAQSSHCLGSGMATFYVESIKNGGAVANASCSSWIVGDQSGHCNMDVLTSFSGDLIGIVRCDQ